MASSDMKSQPFGPAQASEEEYLPPPEGFEPPDARDGSEEAPFDLLEPPSELPPPPDELTRLLDEPAPPLDTPPPSQSWNHSLPYRRPLPCRTTRLSCTRHSGSP